tara:strand:- start:102 stop:539 length:438 start_codon:yes stop_codon:yes gene_type:complete
VLFLYYTRLYSILPEPIPNYFNILSAFLPDLSTVSENIEGIYESVHKQHGFHIHFMITSDILDDKKLIAIKYRGSKNITDDPVKLLEKEILEMKTSALDSEYEYKTPVLKNETGYTIFDEYVEKDGKYLIFKKENLTYEKIRDLN